MFTVKIDGFEEINRRLRQFSERDALKAVRSGVNAGAREVGKIARRKAPKRTGKLRKGIIWKKRRDRGGQITYSIGWNYKKVRYGHLVELGHRIVPRGKKEKSNRGGEMRGSVAPRPHLRPALYAGKNRAIRAIRKKMEQAINKYAGNRTI
jgi:HK97 gp10 family phage protein